MKRKLTIKLSSFQIITLGFIGIILFYKRAVYVYFRRLRYGVDRIRHGCILVGFRSSSNIVVDPDWRHGRGHDGGRVYYDIR